MEIKLTANSPFFRLEQFDTELFNGKAIPVVKTSEENMLSESLRYALYSSDLEVLPSKLTTDAKNKSRKYLCVTNRFYIIIERGESGFETSLHYFTADIKTTSEEITVTISTVDDKEAADTLYAKFIETEYSCSDVFNESIIRLSERRSYNNCSLKQLELLESTEFIHLPYNGNQRKIATRTNSDGELIIVDSKGYKHLDTDKDAFGDIEIGAVLYKRDTDIHDMLEIVKLHHFAKDFYGEFWAVVEVIHTYPADASKIKAEYSDFYSRECMSETALEKHNLLKKAKEIPYVREDYRIGDSIIHIRVDTEQKCNYSVVSINRFPKRAFLTAIKPETPFLRAVPI